MAQQNKAGKPQLIEELEQKLRVSIDDVSISPYSSLFRTFTQDADGKIMSLRLWNCGLSNLDWSANFKDLQNLDLSRNKIGDISALSPLINLQRLALSINKIADISALKPLINLRELEIRGNQISDIAALSPLINLQTLNLSVNEIADISALSPLNYLRTLDVSWNNIDELPVRLLQNNPALSVVNEERIINKNYRLNIFGNPLNCPPYSVVDLGREAIRSYFENKEHYGAEALNEGRIILVGEGSSGKTSLVNRILYNHFDEKENQTNGIKIQEWRLRWENRDLRLNIWDFGGQEIQHAVHKFFFTSGCLYILVLDKRKEEEPEYWLRQIETLGGSAPVLVVFNKTDQNRIETADRKLMRDKYPNIVGFYDISCATGFGLDDFRKALEEQARGLYAINDRFPGNWFAIKKELEAETAATRHYLVYDAFTELCKKHGVSDESTQRLLLRYFSYIGTVTWFGDSSPHLQHMHVLNPAWITQGVYRIVTGGLTQNLKGQISTSDFKELLQPVSASDFEYNEGHYGYLLGLMQKFEICYSANEKDLLIPASFSKEPKMEYSDFRGKTVRTYILQFLEFLPVAIMHRFIVRNIEQAHEKNYWYTGIVLSDNRSNSLAMVHLDKEAKRIYVRIKGGAQLGLWEHVRREFANIASTYAQLPYRELVALDTDAENHVSYEDLVSHLQANEPFYFHARLKKRFNVAYLLGLFESKEQTFEKLERGEIDLNNGNTEIRGEGKTVIPAMVLNILNSNSPNVSAHASTAINIDIDLQFVYQTGSELKGEANYLLEQIANTQVQLTEALKEVVQFAEDAKAAQNKGDVLEKGWGRKLKTVVEKLAKNGEILHQISDGAEVLKNIFEHLSVLARQFQFKDAEAWFRGLL